MVLLAEIPRSLFSSVHYSEVNCGPLSDMRSPGTPKRAIQCHRKPLMYVSVLHPALGIASAHRVYRSTMVKRYVMDSDSGSGTTMSTWRDPKCQSGRVHGCRGALICRCTLED